MNPKEAAALLESLGFTVEEYANTVQVTEAKRTQTHELSIDDIHAALGYKVDKRSIKQIDPWTIVVVF